jgi:hypothetical protein
MGRLTGAGRGPGRKHLAGARGLTISGQRGSPLGSGRGVQCAMWGVGQGVNNRSWGPLRDPLGRAMLERTVDNP